MYKVSLEQTRPISTLPRDYNKLIKEVKKGGEMVFLKGNVPHVVLVDYPYWVKLMEKKIEMEERDAIKAIEMSEGEHGNGKSKELKSLADLWGLK